MALFVIEFLWLSGRASEHRIPRSEVPFLMGTHGNFFSVPRFWQEEKYLCISSPRSKFTIFLFLFTNMFSLLIKKVICLSISFRVMYFINNWLCRWQNGQNPHMSAKIFLKNLEKLEISPKQVLTKIQKNSVGLLPDVNDICHLISISSVSCNHFFFIPIIAHHNVVRCICLSLFFVFPYSWHDFPWMEIKSNNLLIICE